MGLLKDDGFVYKPVNEVDLGPNSKEVYLHADVKGTFISLALACVLSLYTS
ncbi:hypothetical protein HanOQP8_Chr15g0560471 [Helianthus annuus]|nr:hypothetical protein HanOQP8_Chr15g0560471 [Helianthus annuus]